MIYLREDILKQIKISENKKFSIGDGKVVFSKSFENEEDNNGIDAMVKLEDGSSVELHLWRHLDDGEWYLSGVMAAEIKKAIEAFITLSKYTKVNLPDGYVEKVAIVKEVEVEKPVPTDNPVHLEALKVAGQEIQRMKGQLEVYEKLTSASQISFSGRMINYVGPRDGQPLP